MRQKVLVVLLVIGISAVLGATILREPIARAAAPITSVFVSNDAAHPVPVVETRADANGNVTVHEQGTANVNVTNTSLPIAQAAPVIDGGSTVEAFVGDGRQPVTPDATASALMVRFTNAGSDTQMVFRYKGNTVLIVPAALGSGDVTVVTNVPLTRPVKFDDVECVNNGPFDKRLCAAYWAGATP